MANPAVANLIRAAVAEHESGRFPQAAALYEQVLTLDRTNVDALHLLGLIAFQQGSSARAIQLIEQSLKVNDSIPMIWFNFGNVLSSIGNFERSADAFRRALSIQPNFPDAAQCLGNALDQLNLPDQSAAVLETQSKFEPPSPGVFLQLGWTLQRLGRFDAAIAAYRQCLQLQPNSIPTLQNLAAALHQKGDLDSAIALYRQVLQQDPTNADVQANLAVAFHRIGQLDEAFVFFKTALEKNPGNASAHSNLGLLLKDTGQVDAAIGSFQKAIELQPTNPNFHSNLLLTMNYSDQISAEQLFAEHKAWADRHANTLPSVKRTMPHRTAGKFRIGYVSNDFHAHPLSSFFEPILSHHDADRFEVTCYSSTPSPDAVTARLRSQAEHWVDIATMNDAAVAEQIAGDGIDLLVDLAGHTADHRLLVFARRPAPVLVTYLGYPGTTGMAAMNYRLTGALADPPGLTESSHTEKLIRLPGCFLCYHPPAAAPPVAPLPFDANGYITFGSFNHAGKITATTLKLWATALLAVPKSRLTLKALGFMHPATRQRLLGELEELGIAQERVTLLAVESTFADHLAQYGRLDIALETFPYHGTTSTCEALWMGVPVISLAGSTHASRVGVSILTAAGLPQLVADSAEDFARIAAELAGQPESLGELRREMRHRLQQSVLLDGESFTGNLETVYENLIAAKR